MVRIVLKISSMVAMLIVCVSSVVFAQAADDTIGGLGISKILEYGGQPLSFILAMYWLKDSTERRMEEARRHTEMVRDLKRTHKEEILKLYSEHSQITQKLFDLLQQDKH